MTTQSKTAKGCGCGTGCGCGGGVCETECGPCADSGFQRPRFFAGQLLTEEDLQLLTHYVTGKNRLHNKHFIGEGVVCGLEVNCHPCGDGQVIVKPGYALDCCGNDLLLECETTLDVNEMIRDLRARVQAGYDCGDPCEDPGKDGKQAERRYDLFLRYRENETDPISPYAANEPCSVQCEPTRVVEGVCFELDCPKDAEPPPDLFSKLKDCIGDVAEAAKSLGDARFYIKQASRAKTSFDIIAKDEAIPFTERDGVLLTESAAALQEYAAAYANQAPDKLEIARALDRYQATASAVSRSYLNDNASDGVFAASQALAQAAPLLKAHSANLESQRERVFAGAAIDSGLFWSDANLDYQIRNTTSGKAYATGTDLNVLNTEQTSMDLAALREWLLCRLDSGCVTDCTLKDEVQAVIVGGQDEQTVETALVLARALIRYLQACICCALHPPCPVCDDPRVLLARLTVVDCDVTRICNLERTFALTAVALRYWVPILGSIGDALERLCCTLVPELEPSPRTTDAFDNPEYYADFASAAMPVAAESQLSRTLTYTGVPRDNIYAFSAATDTIIELTKDSGLETNLDKIRTPAPGADLATALTTDRGRRVLSDSVAVALDPKGKPAQTLIQEARAGFRVDSVNVINAFGDPQVRGALRNELGAVIDASLTTGIDAAEDRINANLDNLVQDKIDALEFPDAGLKAEDLAKTETVMAIVADITAVRGRIEDFVTADELGQTDAVKAIAADVAAVRGRIENFVTADELGQTDAVKSIVADIAAVRGRIENVVTADELAQTDAVKNIRASLDDLQASVGDVLRADQLAEVPAIRALSDAVDEFQAKKSEWLTADDLAASAAVKDLAAAVAKAQSQNAAAGQRLDSVESTLRETANGFSEVKTRVDQLQGSLAGYVRADELADHPEIVALRESRAGSAELDPAVFESRVKKIVTASALTPQKLTRNATIKRLNDKIDELATANAAMAERLARLEG